MKDLRRYAGQTNKGLLIGFVLLLFLVGGGLVYWLYGRGAAVMSIICIFAGLAPLLLIWLALLVVDWVAKKANE
jgi:hypothetical protein